MIQDFRKKVKNLLTHGLLLFKQASFPVPGKKEKKKRNGFIYVEKNEAKC